MVVVKTEVLNSADVWLVRLGPEVRKGLDGGRIAPNWPESEGVSEGGSELQGNSRRTLGFLEEIQCQCFELG